MANIYLATLLILVPLCWAKEICFEETGCLSLDDPWVSLTRPLPDPVGPDVIQLQLYLYTREKNERFVVTPVPGASLEGSSYNKDRRTAFMTHGFASDGNVTWLEDMKENYLKAVDANVFLVDWGKGAADTNYLQVAHNTRVVGKLLGKFISNLMKDGLKKDDIHLIGHSLGGQISGYTAKTVKEETDKRVAKITALDPAQPGFENEPEKVRLAKGDAKFLEVVHSDAKPFIPTFGFGFISALGDVDFYLNSGTNQPGCIDSIPAELGKITGIDVLKDIAVEVLMKAVACSHGRAYVIYTASIDPEAPCNYTGYRTTTLTPVPMAGYSCPDGDSCLNMGLYTEDEGKEGTFVVRTTADAPYCCTSYNLLNQCVA